MSYEHKDAVRAFEQAVDAPPDAYVWNHWHVYPKYLIKEREGHRYLCALISAEQVSGRQLYRPLERGGSSLFLEFARWPEEYGMDRKPLDSDKNEEAALEWARTFGVLGLDPPDISVQGESSGATRFFLQGPAPDGFLSKGSRSEATGGPLETVERFAGEAWEANMTLRLYEAASNPGGVDVDTIVGFMPDDGEEWMNYRGVREFHGRTQETARSWALSVVEEIVERKIRGRCWPIPVPDGSSHKQGWGFDSLLGAMWLQMLWLMLGQPRRCELCGKLLNVGLKQEQDLQTTGIDGGQRKPRSDRRFCNDAHRAKWNYHRGEGKSSKRARKKLRDRRQGNA